MSKDITEYLIELDILRRQMAENLKTKGADASENDGFEALVPKVLLAQKESCFHTMGSIYPAGGFGSVVYALTSGSAKHGTIKLVEPLSTEIGLVIDTGLTSLHGFIIWIDGISGVDGYSSTGFGFVMFDDEGNEITKGHLTTSWGTTTTSATSLVARGSYEVEGGKMKIWPTYNKHTTLTPLIPNYDYMWVAW